MCKKAADGTQPTPRPKTENKDVSLGGRCSRSLIGAAIVVRVWELRTEKSPDSTRQQPRLIRAPPRPSIPPARIDRRPDRHHRISHPDSGLVSLTGIVFFVFLSSLSVSPIPGHLHTAPSLRSRPDTPQLDPLISPANPLWRPPKRSSNGSFSPSLAMRYIFPFLIYSSLHR